jgi:endonuclease-8
MPEGPSIVILNELISNLDLVGSKVQEVSGNTKIEKERMLGQKVTAFKSWGKHFLICFPDFSLRIHFMLFGTYRINERKATQARLSLGFPHAELNFYTCSLQFVEGDVNLVYDWNADVMSDTWDEVAALKKLQANPDALVCDMLLDQEIFAGVGNIIKNEVLFRIRLHPLSQIKHTPLPLLKLLVEEARIYAFDFLEWKKAFTLKAHWLAHTKKICPRCNIPFHKAYLGKTNRRSFFCENCQVLHATN